MGNKLEKIQKRIKSIELTDGLNVEELQNLRKFKKLVMLIFEMTKEKHDLEARVDMLSTEIVAYKEELKEIEQRIETKRLK